jgi:protein-tyrosine kinase
MANESVSKDNIMLHRGGSELLAPSPAAHELVREDWSERGVVGFNSRDRRSRPFNLLRSQVMKATAATGWRVIGITSPTPRVGKSFIASNLSASLARIPTLHTMLFDLDLRRGSIAEVFDIEGPDGISSYLAGDTDTLDAARWELPGAHLTIYPTYPSDHSSAELLASERMVHMIEAMKSLSEDTICICDLPPVFANDDAAIIVRQIDAYLLVVEEGRSTVRQVRDAMELLKPAPCIGTVLNRYHGGFGGDDYGFGYGRQQGYEAYYS